MREKEKRINKENDEDIQGPQRYQIVRDPEFSKIIAVNELRECGGIKYLNLSEMGRKVASKTTALNYFRGHGGRG